MAEHNTLGKEGEKAATAFLMQKGYKILAKNWRYKKAEIDIIAMDANTLVIAEVKTRSTNQFGDPQDFISSKKIKLLVAAANEYVISNNIDAEVRFDVIAILSKTKPFQIEHLTDAFLHF